MRIKSSEVKKPSKTTIFEALIMIKGYTLFPDDNISQKVKYLLRIQCKKKALLPAVSSSRNNLLYLEKNIVEKCKFHDFSFSHTISKKNQFLSLGNLNLLTGSLVGLIPLLNLLLILFNLLNLFCQSNYEARPLYPKAMYPKRFCSLL